MRIACVILALTLALPACDSDSTPPGGNQPGTFSATVTGTVAATLSGIAASGGAAASGGWGIALGPGDPQSITLLASGNDRPPAGTYPIVVFAQGGTAGGTAFVASIVAEPGVSSYTSTGGTVTLSSSSASRVAGSFAFAAQRGTVSNPQNVDVTGTFDATNAPTGGR